MAALVVGLVCIVVLACCAYLTAVLYRVASVWMAEDDDGE